MSDKMIAEELPDDIEVVGPGQMLAEAREKAGLTQKDVADKLNFRTTLVKEIEVDRFDKTLPDTFNRGYLKNYAKLVNISEEEVLASYDSLNVAKKQGAEMQSFSRETEKQAEHSRLMWISYIILAVLIGSSIMWWFQDSKQESSTEISKPTEITKAEGTANDRKLESITDQPESKQEITDTPEVAQQAITENVDKSLVSLSETLIANGQEQSSVTNDDTTELRENVASLVDEAEQGIEEVIAPVKASFLFSGDCWVNIYDASGERLAWGIKKSGYEMKISGQAPFTVTLGKPELVSIVFDGKAIDMSHFRQDQIAKFTLPLSE